MTTENRPDFRAFTIVKRANQKDVWIPIGAAFRHRNGGGINVVLQATPLDGRIVLRTPADEDSVRSAQA